MFSPSSLERSILNSYISDCQNRHEILCHELTKATNASGVVDKTLLFYLCRDRILLAEKYERCQVALVPGPIRRMPPEIISEIFRHSLPQLRRPDPSIAPLLLCRVSCLWRDIAYATRDLWNCLDFTPQTKPNLQCFIQSPPTAPLHRWISHARTSCLDISFSRLGTNFPPDLVTMVLLPNVTDIVRLAIHRPLEISHGLFQHFAALPPHTLRSLKILILAQGLENAQVSVFESSPHLTHLSLDDLSSAVDPHEPGDVPVLRPIFPWIQLTHLVITRCIQPEAWLAAFSLCQSLEVASFSIDLGGDLGNDTDEDEDGHFCSDCQIPSLDKPVVFPYLKELDIIVGCGRSFPIRDLHFPALKALRFHHGHMPQVMVSRKHLPLGQPDHFSWKKSLPFVSELPSLRILSLAGQVGSVKEIMTLLRHVPSVDFLDLNIDVDYLDLFRNLVVNPHLHPIPLPRLGYLRLVLEPHDISSFSETILQEMVLSRCQPTPNISRLENLGIGSRTFPLRNFNNARRMVESANSYIQANFEVESSNSSRLVPWKRCIEDNLWRTW